VTVAEVVVLAGAVPAGVGGVVTAAETASEIATMSVVSMGGSS
jgi:hypothetical protein